MTCPIFGHLGTLHVVCTHVPCEKHTLQEGLRLFLSCEVSRRNLCMPFQCTMVWWSRPLKSMSIVTTKKSFPFHWWRRMTNGLTMGVTRTAGVARRKKSFASILITPCSFNSWPWCVNWLSTVFIKKTFNFIFMHTCTCIFSKTTIFFTPRRYLYPSPSEVSHIYFQYITVTNKDKILFLLKK